MTLHINDSTGLTPEGVFLTDESHLLAR